VLLRAAHHGIALINAHTNLDRAPEGADALPLAVGLTPVSPLETGRMRVAVVTVYTPEDSAELVVERMTSAGAGGVGRYRGCAFVSSGQGTFIPGPGSAPAVGDLGERAHAREQRIEMVCDPNSVASVVEAARSAHPYEEPVILVSEKEIERGAARLGRLSEAPGSPTLSGFAADVAARLGCTPTVWGDARRTVRLVATNCGSGGALLQDALRAGASVFLTGEVRYHIALEAIQSGMAVIEAGHDVTEWPLVEVLVRALRLHAGLADRVVADKPVALWWTP
jgi:putative NIF3 family GTP cyclohydrolase 1 type 2